MHKIDLVLNNLQCFDIINVYGIIFVLRIIKIQFLSSSFSLQVSPSCISGAIFLICHLKYPYSVFPHFCFLEFFS